MPAPMSSPRVPFDTSVASLEESIDRLADLARNTPEPSVFLPEILKHAILPPAVTQSLLWGVDQASSWRLQAIEPVSSGEGLTPPDEQQQRTLCQVASQRQPIRDRHAILLPISSDGSVPFILEVRAEADASVHLLAYFSALAEIASDFLIRHELRRFRSREKEHVQWERLRQQLSSANDLLTACVISANDGRSIIGCDRVSIATREGRQFVLRAVSGVDHLEERSTAVRSLESVAQWVAERAGELWSDGDQLNELNTDSTIARHWRDTGAKAMGAIPILGSSGKAIAVWLFEQFEVGMNQAQWREQSQRFVRETSDVIRSRWIEGEWGLSRWGGAFAWWPSALRKPGVLIGAILATLVVAVLCLVPADFTVSGPAKLWPVHQREIFASSRGIVDQLLVKHGDRVNQNQPLLVLRDTELDAEYPRLLGEIATIAERLRAVQASRLASGGNSDPAGNVRRAAADEEELKVRLATLETQRTLLESRRVALTHASPINGQILTWDVESTLAGRPVDRGQSLLTVGEVDGPWNMEIDVSDRDAGEIILAREVMPELPVEFILAAAPEVTYQGVVRDVALSTETDSQGHSYVRILAEINHHEIAHLRPGAVVIPRIQCGQKSLGAVWFHDLIVAVRSRLLF